jgi:hypothetical protein
MHTLKPRNPYACSPLLKKGGAHRSSRSGLRQNARQAMLAELDELMTDWIDPPRQPRLSSPAARTTHRAVFPASPP